MADKRLRVVVLIGLVATLLIFIFVIYIRSNSGKEDLQEIEFPVFNDDGTVTLPLNAVGHGVRDPKTSKTISFKDVISPVQGKVNVVYEIQQNMPEAKEYILLILVDDEQRKFTLNGNELMSYTFTLGRESKLLLNIEIAADEKSDHDMMFVIFQEPNYMETDDAMGAVGIRPAYSSRFLLQNVSDKSPDLKYIKGDKTVEYRSDLRDIFITNDVEVLTVHSVSEGGQKMEAVLSNNRDHEIIYAVGSFLDWKQYPFEDGDMVKYIKIPPQSTKVFELTIPDVSRVTPYQVFATPCGYWFDDDVEFDTSLYRLSASIRTIVTPKGYK